MGEAALKIISDYEEPEFKDGDDDGEGDYDLFLTFDIETICSKFDFDEEEVAEDLEKKFPDMTLLEGSVDGEWLVADPPEKYNTWRDLYDDMRQIFGSDVSFKIADVGQQAEVFHDDIGEDDLIKTSDDRQFIVEVKIHYGNIELISERLKERSREVQREKEKEYDEQEESKYILAKTDWGEVRDYFMYTMPQVMTKEKAEFYVNFAFETYERKFGKPKPVIGIDGEKIPEEKPLDAPVHFYDTIFEDGGGEVVDDQGWELDDDFFIGGNAVLDDEEN